MTISLEAVSAFLIVSVPSLTVIEFVPASVRIFPLIVRLTDLPLFSAVIVFAPAPPLSVVPALRFPTIVLVEFAPVKLIVFFAPFPVIFPLIVFVPVP